MAARVHTTWQAMPAWGGLQHHDCMQRGTAPDPLAVQYGRPNVSLLRQPPRPSTHQTKAACGGSTRLTPAARVTSQPLAVLQPPTQLMSWGAHGPCLKHGTRTHVPRRTAHAASPTGAPASPTASREGSGEGGTAITDDSSPGTHRSVGPPTVQEVSQPSDAALGAAMGGSVDATVTSNGSNGDSSASSNENTYDMGTESGYDGSSDSDGADDSGFINSESADLNDMGVTCDEDVCALDFGDY